LRELVFSCVRLRGRYDHVLAVRSRRAKTPAPELRAVFWIALHELIELDHKPHAVVDEAVSCAAAVGVGHARGFVNGVLRGLLRDGVRHDFPEPARARDYATSWLSHPAWMVDRWSAALGEEEMLALCEANNERPRLYLRCAPGRQQALASALAELDWQSAPVEFLPDGLELLTRVPPALLLGQVEEACTLQDAAAQLVAPLLAGPKGQRVLDLCAAPGGKTTHLAGLMPDANIVACDLSAARIRRLSDTADRLELRRRIGVVVADAARAPFAPGSFDSILLDAPCTGTGVLSRRHEARWVRRPADLVELAALQRVLLDAALDLVAPGGQLVYATCSLEPEENDEVVDFALAHREDVREWPLTDEAPAEFLRKGRLATWPHRHGIDGAFAARLRKLTSNDGARE
jgi:16S rRNA (cytosine967-C5)-methyltransferase